MPRKLHAHLALLAVNLIYGANYAVAKALMPGVIGPSGFIVLRVVGAGLLFWAVRVLLPERIRLADLPRLLLCGITGVAVNQLFFFHGLMRTSPLHASLIMVATPILVLVMSAILLRERITWTKVLGIALGALGAGTVLWMGASGGERGATLIGDVYILINATSFALFLVLVKPLMQRYSAITVMAWSFLLGSLVVLPFGSREALSLEWRHLPVIAWAGIAFVVLVVTFLAYLLNTWALRRVDPGVVGAYIYLQPVMAVGFSWLYATLRFALPGSEPQVPVVGVGHAVGAACIFLGVHLVYRSDRDR